MKKLRDLYFFFDIQFVSCILYNSSEIRENFLSLCISYWVLPWHVDPTLRFLPCSAFSLTGEWGWMTSPPDCLTTYPALPKLKSVFLQYQPIPRAPHSLSPGIQTVSSPDSIYPNSRYPYIKAYPNLSFPTIHIPKLRKSLRVWASILFGGMVISGEKNKTKRKLLCRLKKL